MPQSLPVRIFRFYVDGFRSMTVGRQLWLIIGIKLVIMFAILKFFFFPDVVAQKTPEGGTESQTVRSEILQRSVPVSDNSDNNNIIQPNP